MKRLQDEMQDQEDAKEESICCFKSCGAGARGGLFFVGGGWGVVGNFGVKGNPLETHLWELALRAGAKRKL